MPYIGIEGEVHSDDCPSIVPDLDPVRYASELPADRSPVDCNRCRR
ncbi:MAG: hypothetical protein ABEJ34_00325 [Haloferacaceae archaeon]